MLCFVKDPMEYLDAALKNRWNTNGRNDNSKGSNGIPLVQHEGTNGRAMEGIKEKKRKIFTYPHTPLGRMEDYAPRPPTGGII